MATTCGNVLQPPHSALLATARVLVLLERLLGGSRTVFLLADHGGLGRWTATDDIAKLGCALLELLLRERWSTWPSAARG